MLIPHQTYGYSFVEKTVLSSISLTSYGFDCHVSQVFGHANGLNTALAHSLTRIRRDSTSLDIFRHRYNPTTGVSVVAFTTLSETSTRRDESIVRPCAGPAIIFSNTTTRTRFEYATCYDSQSAVLVTIFSLTEATRTRTNFSTKNGRFGTYTLVYYTVFGQTTKRLGKTTKRVCTTTHINHVTDKGHSINRLGKTTKRVCATTINYDGTTSHTTNRHRYVITIATTRPSNATITDRNPTTLGSAHTTTILSHRHTILSGRHSTIFHYHGHVTIRVGNRAISVIGYGYPNRRGIFHRPSLTLIIYVNRLVRQESL